MSQRQIYRADTAEYPIVPPDLLERVRAARSSVKLGTYHCAVVTLANVSFQAVQDVFATLHAQHEADPRYLFISEVDAPYFSKSIMQALVKQHHLATQIVNQATKRLVHVVSLPDLTPGTVLCGFFLDGQTVSGVDEYDG